MASLDKDHSPIRVQIVCLPSFNLYATMAFIDPLRIANYLSGRQIFTWLLVSPDGGPQLASNAATIDTEKIQSRHFQDADWIVVSSSWSPEEFGKKSLLRQLSTAAARGVFIAGIDTGGFLLAAAGLLDGHAATVHYEHIDAFAEKYPDVDVVEDLFVITHDRGTCCGGAAATDFVLTMMHDMLGSDLSNAVARYMFHGQVRAGRSGQHPIVGEPFGFHAPALLKEAITLMEQNLELPITIPEIAERVGASQRKLERLFKTHTKSSAVRYYANARLDRARGLVTQTSLPITEVALASGFPSPEHFTRAYRKRFDLTPREDRIEGRVPFEFRAWPMHSALKSS